MTTPSQADVQKWATLLWPVIVVLLHDLLGLDIPNLPTSVTPVGTPGT